MTEPAPGRNGPNPGISRSRTRGEIGETAIHPEDYSRHLRIIGQQLEKIRLATFNLECTGTSYLIRFRAERTDPENRFPSHLIHGQLPKWLRIKNQFRISEREDESSYLSANSASIEFSLKDLEFLDEAGKNHRLQTSGLTNGHSLSQLLRTLGALVNQRNHRLLGISWRDLSICIVVETAQGRRDIDVFRPDNLYDLWVRMYLKRENRALSDVPY